MGDTKKKKGLGRGLMSLFGDQEISAPKGDVKNDWENKRKIKPKIRNKRYSFNDVW